MNLLTATLVFKKIKKESVIHNLVEKFSKIYVITSYGFLSEDF